jgi:hypothetical protein
MTIFSVTENAAVGMLVNSVENHIITGSQVISSIGSQPYTVGGTVATGIYQFQLKLTRASDGRELVQEGIFTYLNTPTPSINDFAAKFAAHLTLYYDVRASSAAAVLTVSAAMKGYTPDLLLRNGTITLTAGTRVAATVPAPFAYGDVVQVSKNAAGEFVASYPTAVATERPQLGVVVNDGYTAVDPISYKSAHNRTWGILLRGDIWVRQAGGQPVDSDDFAIGLVGTRLVSLESLAGKFLGTSGWDVAGTLPSVGKWRSADSGLATAPGRFTTLDVGTPSGQLFRVSVN